MDDLSFSSDKGYLIAQWNKHNWEEDFFIITKIMQDDLKLYIIDKIDNDDWLYWNFSYKETKMTICYIDPGITLFSYKREDSGKDDNNNVSELAHLLNTIFRNKIGSSKQGDNSPPGRIN